MFYFPRSNRELWANSTALKQASPYSKTIFESQFKEGVASTRVSVAATPSPPSDEDHSLDSDDEADKVPFKLAATRTEASLPAGVREVVITSTAYTTYHTTLVWMLYDHIAFAPLTNTPFLLSAEPNSKASPPAVDPDLPLPASPKSVYALAHLLELPDLMKLALNNLRSQLTADNVLYQIVSDVAVHDEVRQSITAFAKTRWRSIRNTSAAVELGTSEVHQLVGSEAMARLFELARKC